MKVLYVDTTTADLVVAVVEENKIYDVSSGNVGTRHSETLCGKVAEVLACANVNFDELDAYACAIGPGSFTGIRIGVATVKGYKTAVDKPYIAVNCLEAIAKSQNCANMGSAIIDAGNGYYFADYSNGVAPCLIGYDDERASAAGKSNSAIEYFDGALHIIREKFGSHSFDETLSPLYIRKSQAEERK